jgi:5-formyltetrahydrofolate cyclo-ligase
MAVPSPSPPPGKSELRAEGLLRRRDFARSLTPELRVQLEAELARLVLPHLAGAGVVAAYHPLRDEIDPAAILAGLGAGQRRALPWFADRDSVFLWREGPAAEPSPWGVAQPPAAAEALLPDVVIVPLVLADRSGMRIGHGKGHYDRALARLREGGRPVFTVGICWESQLVDAPIPADPWDARLDAVATPNEWVQCG